MTDVTPIYGFPFPEGTDAPDGPTQFENLALAVEAVLARMDTQTTVRKYTATGVTVWNKPSGLKGVWVRVTGGGGGSGGTTTTGVGDASPAAGGGGGGVAEVWIPAASLGATENYSVGAGGTAGASAGGTGGTGGTTSFGTVALVSASGGGGGVGAGAGTGRAYTGGSQGAGGATFGGSVSPRIEYQGGTGQRGYRESGTFVLGGNGGASGLGAPLQQANQRTSGANSGVAGNVPGGGSAGGFLYQSQSGAAGVAGARGEIMIIEVY